MLMSVRVDQIQLAHVDAFVNLNAPPGRVAVASWTKLQVDPRVHIATQPTSDRHMIMTTARRRRSSIKKVPTSPSLDMLGR